MSIENLAATVRALESETPGVEAIFRSLAVMSEDGLPMQVLQEQERQAAVDALVNAGIATIGVDPIIGGERLYFNRSNIQKVLIPPS